VRRLAVIGILVAACSGQSPDAKLAKSLDAPASWMSGLAMIGEKWSANSVPRAYVEKSLDAAADEFDKTTKSVRESNASPLLRNAVLKQLAAAQASSSSMRGAIEANDRARVARDSRELADAGKQLSEIAEDAAK
jgi:hypothetical protein